MLDLPSLTKPALLLGRIQSALRVRRHRLSILRSAILGAALLPAAASALEVASLHPLMADLARQVGQDRVTVIELIGPEDNPHVFDPSPRTFEAIADAPIILASGKGLESNYLPKLADALQPNQEIFEVGRGVHSLVAADGNLAPCCAHHRHTGIIDPHWWHDPDNMRRAAYELADQFGDLDPENAEFYEENAKAYAQTLRTLDNWIESRFAEFPPSERELATSHLAFGYLCRKYDLTAVAIQGLNREDTPSPRGLAEIISYLGEENVTVLFPEYGSNPKALETIAKEAGVQVGAPLFSDGNGLPSGEGYLYMMRSNVNAIVDGWQDSSS